MSLKSRYLLRACLSVHLISSSVIILKFNLKQHIWGLPKSSPALHLGSILSSQAVGEDGWLINSRGNVLRGSTLGKERGIFLDTATDTTTCQDRCGILASSVPQRDRSSSTWVLDGQAWCWSWLPCCRCKGVHSIRGGNYPWQCCERFCSHFSSCSHLQGCFVTGSESLWAPGLAEE